MGMDSYADDVREHWVLSWPGQIVLCVSQTYWTADVHKAIRQDQLNSGAGCVQVVEVV